MGNGDTMLHGRLPDLLSPHCNAKSASCKDAISSLSGLVTMFVATIVDAKDFIVQLEALFCNELWPAMYSDIAKSTCRVLELENCLDESKKQNDERDRLELEQRQEWEAEKACFLGENDALRTELEQQKLTIQKALESAQSSLSEADQLEKKRMNDKLHTIMEENRALQQRLSKLLEDNLNHEKQRQSWAEEVKQLHAAANLSVTKQLAEQLEKKLMNDKFHIIVEENVALQQRVGKLLEDNLNHEKQCQTLAGEVEQLREEAKVSVTKKLILEAENQRLGKTRAVSEKSHMLETRRLTLKKQEKLPKGNCPGQSLIENCAESIPVVGKNPQPTEGTALVQSVPILHRQPNSEANNDEVLLVSNSKSSDREHVKETRSTSPVGLDVRPVDRGAVAAFLEPIQVEDKYQSGLVEDSDFVHILNVACSQRPEAGCDEEPNGGPNALDSDETTMDVIQQQQIPPVTPNVTCIAPENHAASCCALGLHVSGSLVVNEAQERKDEDAVVEKMEAPLEFSQRRPPSCRPSTNMTLGHKDVNRPKEHPWRKTRSPAESRQGDPHDSFLDTPRERVLAKIAAARDQTETVSLAMQRAQVPACSRPKEPVADGSDAIIAEKAVAEKAAAQIEHSAIFRVVADASSSGGQDRKEKLATSSKAPAYKFNETVRKKRDREALQGTDCKQCKKFYDAVEAEDANGAMMSRCEHHDAVSRHRFQYLPPPTPEGFWNIGFESDL